MTTQTITKDSFYLERLKTKFNNQGGYWSVGDTTTSIWQPHTRKSFEFITETKLIDITFDEQIYKGFQLILIGFHYEFRTVLDLTGVPSPQYLADNQIGGYMKDVRSFVYYESIAYEIGGVGDLKQELNWLGEVATLYMYGGDTDPNKVIKKCQKKLDLLSQIMSVRDELISISNERAGSYDTKNPYNINVGDQVFIQAHGRLRKGKIVSTTGSRFIVGYLTPSNHNDLKYKTLRLDSLWIPTQP
jgi:hypothetical protein